VEPVVPTQQCSTQVKIYMYYLEGSAYMHRSSSSSCWSHAL
jgi:hypothetical protein